MYGQVLANPAPLAGCIIRSIAGRANNDPSLTHMEFDPAVHDVQDLIRDYEHDFGIRMSYEDAERILVLYEELCELFAKNSVGEPIPPHHFLD